MEGTWVLLCCLLPLVTPKSPTALRFSKTLDTDGAVVLRWDYNREAHLAVFELEVITLGWLGFGLSPNGGMTGADIVIGGVFPNKTVYFADYHSTQEGAPTLDDKQDYKLMSLTESGRSTIMRFCRHFKTCDPNDMDITDETMRIIFAYGIDDVIGYHQSHRGGKSIYLLQEEEPGLLATPSIIMTQDLRIRNFTIPAQDTTYACTFFALPTVTKKHHIYKFEPIIQSGNEALVHHIVLYSCPRMANITALTGECQNRMGNDAFSVCLQNMAAWAVGGEAFQFPSDVGISLGTSEDPTNIMMEIHYSNFLSVAGLQDSSGMRLYYTPELRKHDAGILEVGPTVEHSLFIPPKLESFKAYGICKLDNFTKLSPAVEEMQVFATLLHTHLAGRAVQIAHFRNGSQIGFLGRDMNYDFNLQETRLLKDTATLKMGDEIVVECTYNTMDRTNITLGGLGTKNEMCMGFLYIFPRSNVTNCVSYPDPVAIAQGLGRNVSSVYQAFAAIKSYSWDAKSARVLEEMSRDSLHFIYLLSQTGIHSGGVGHVRNITVPASGPCTNTSTDGMPGHDTLDQDMTDDGMPGPPGGHLVDMNSSCTLSSSNSFLLLLTLFFQARTFF